MKEAGEGRGTGSLFYERRLATLNLVIVIMREDKKRGTIVAFNCTMEVEQEHFRERKMLAQANVCTIDINTVRLGIKRCFSSLNQSSLKQLFKQSKDGIKEEIFRQFLLSSKEEQHDVLTL